MRDFSDQVWARVECSVAFQVVAQKFMKSPELQELLLREDWLSAEMTRKDTNWGTGIDRSEPREGWRAIRRDGVSRTCSAGR